MYFRNGDGAVRGRPRVGGGAVGRRRTGSWPKGRPATSSRRSCCSRTRIREPVKATIRYLTNSGVARVETRTLAADQPHDDRRGRDCPRSRPPTSRSTSPRAGRSSPSARCTGRMPGGTARTTAWASPTSARHGRWPKAKSAVRSAPSRYILLANPGAAPADVTLTFYREGGLRAAVADAHGAGRHARHGAGIGSGLRRRARSSARSSTRRSRSPSSARSTGTKAASGAAARTKRARALDRRVGRGG